MNIKAKITFWWPHEGTETPSTYAPPIEVVFPDDGLEISEWDNLSRGEQELYVEDTVWEHLTYAFDILSITDEINSRVKATVDLTIYVCSRPEIAVPWFGWPGIELVSEHTEMTIDVVAYKFEESNEDLYDDIKDTIWEDLRYDVEFEVS